MSEIRTIFWDIGGVILSNGWDRFQRVNVLKPLGIDLAAFEKRHASESFLWERGRITAEEYFNRTVFKPKDVVWPAVDYSFEDIWPKVCQESSLHFPESFDMLVSLKSSGRFKLATLNNESAELNAFRLDTFELRKQFDYFICSAYVNEMKPHPDIFRTAISVSGHPASSAIFIDDKQQNVDAARYHGMTALRFDSPAQLRASLEELGITV